MSKNENKNGNCQLSFVFIPKSKDPLSEQKKTDQIKRGCRRPSNKFEILWQVAQYSFSLLLSHFVAQYVPIIVVQFFCENVF